MIEIAVLIIAIAFVVLVLGILFVLKKVSETIEETKQTIKVLTS
ncbi:TPA: DUF948 domain-containing protein, partial [Streptococcus agalactiae]